MFSLQEQPEQGESISQGNSDNGNNRDDSDNDGLEMVWQKTPETAANKQDTPSGLLVGCNGDDIMSLKITLETLLQKGHVTGGTKIKELLDEVLAYQDKQNTPLEVTGLVREYLSSAAAQRAKPSFRRNSAMLPTGCLTSPTSRLLGDTPSSLTCTPRCSRRSSTKACASFP